MFTPDTNTTYTLHLAHLEDIRIAQVNAHAAELVQGDQPNRIKAIVAGVVAFAKHLSSRPVEAIHANDMPPMQLSNEQA